MEMPKRLQKPRGMVLSILGVITLAVAVLSVAVTYDILEPWFGGWAVPTVGALDALWVVFQATEILAYNNKSRARRVQYAGLALTLINAAVPTAHLILAAKGGAPLDLAVVITPIAVIATKGAWWMALPSLGRPVSDTTRQNLATKRQTVADRLEEMEAEAAHRIELLELATTLETRVAAAETNYRVSVLKAQQDMTQQLHGQAETTEKTIAEKPFPRRSRRSGSRSWRAGSRPRPPCPAQPSPTGTPSARRSAACHSKTAHRPAHLTAHRHSERHGPPPSRTSQPWRVCPSPSPANR